MDTYKLGQCEKYATSVLMKKQFIVNLPKDILAEELYKYCKSFIEDFEMMKYCEGEIVDVAQQ